MTALRAEAPARPAGWRRPLRRLRDRLGASDPAFSRLRMASRAMLSLALCVVLLLGVHQVHPLPFAVFGLAFVISFNGTLAVRDKGWRAQAQTRAIAWVAAGVAVAAASLLAAWPIAADAAFLAVIFAAVYARALGPRWTAVGMISFMAFFMGDYFKPPVADLPWIAAGAALAFIVTQIVTNVILPDDPARDFRRALVSLDQRLQVMLRQLLEHPVDRPKMQAELSRLRDVVMMAEGFIPQGDDGSLAARGPASELAIALFDVQLIAERLARASYVAAPPPALVRAAMSGATLP
ncbi:MAG TPA: FUSC family protein, partial [Devosia sp.]|nr:FUSC family protein [Devosia sp.]